VHRVDGDHSQDILEQDQSLKSAAFGVAYTFSQVKLDAEIHMGLLRLALDYLQLLLVMLHFGHHWEFRQNGCVLACAGSKRLSCFTTAAPVLYSTCCQCHVHNPAATATDCGLASGNRAYGLLRWVLFTNPVVDKASVTFLARWWRLAALC
jgi:hypothetical protein